MRALVFPGIILFLTACSPVVSHASTGMPPGRASRLAAAASAAPTVPPPAYQAQASGGNNARDDGGMQKDCLLNQVPDGQSNQLDIPGPGYSFESDGKLLVLFGESTSDPGTGKTQPRSTIPFVATFIFAACTLATPNVLAEAPPASAVGAG